VGTHADVDLVLLKLDAAGRLDREQPLSLGTAVDVRERIRAAVAPAATIQFTERGEGRCIGNGYVMRFSLGGAENVAEVAVQVQGRRTDAFALLRTLCDRTGWTLYDRATGRFPDLSAPDPLRATSAPPPFYWWTRLPGWVRVLVGLLIGWLLLQRLLIEIAFP
jgi:hypothetical protein